jgi:hypothetical protein
VLRGECVPRLGLCLMPLLLVFIRVFPGTGHGRCELRMSGLGAAKLSPCIRWRA